MAFASHDFTFDISKEGIEMTIGLTDLLRRTAPLLIIALPLAACDKQQIETAVAAIKGDPIPVDTRYALTTQSSSSAEPMVEQVAVTTEPSSSVEYVPPPPPPCDPVQWRGNWYSCDMMVLLGPVE